MTGKPLDCVGVQGQTGKTDLKLYQPPEDHTDIHEHRKRFVGLIEGQRLQIAKGTER